jgi:nucleotidyltransferase substrate binding protein (TIGR01987 family)
MFNDSVVFQDFKRAVERLSEVLAMEKTPVVRDSAIKRFEFCFDLSWKTIKAYAKIQGLGCASPRDAIKTAFTLKLIAYDEKWLSMIDDRNCTVHLYKEDYADAVYLRLSVYLNLFGELIKSFSR